MRECAHDCRCPHRPEAWKPPKTGVKDSSAPPNGDTRNQTQFIYKSKSIHALNCCHLSKPRYSFENLLNVKLFKIGAGKMPRCRESSLVCRGHRSIPSPSFQGSQPIGTPVICDLMLSSGLCTHEAHRYKNIHINKKKSLKTSFKLEL